MNRIALSFAALALASGSVLAAPFAGADVQAGARLHAEQCAGCHIARFGGDGSRIYTRPDRQVKSIESLVQRITTCNANLGNNLFPDDEANLGAWLNQTHYRFK